MADASSPPGRSMPKFRRCRTGCLRCRTRRRKCDERKPRCQNCIDKDLDCSYGLQVSFLPKNTFTVAADELRPLKPNENYKQIQFVNDDPLTHSPDASAQDSPSPVRSDTAVSPDNATHDSILAHEEHGIERSESNGRELSGNGGIEGDAVRETPASTSWSTRDHDSDNQVPLLESESPREEDAFNAKHESAAHGLLALGTSSSGNEVSSTERSYYLSRRHSSAAHSKGPSEAGITQASELSSSASVHIGVAPNASTLELLRHYRYNVAPWLDVCDLRHPFGIYVVQIAMSSEQVYSAVMRLSAACVLRRNLYRPQESETFAPSTTDLKNHVPHSPFTEEALLAVLNEVLRFVSHVPETWKSTQQCDANLLNALAEQAFDFNIHSTIYWMFLRLELGWALANDSPIRIPLPMSHIPSLLLLSRTDDTCERVSHYAHVILWLCGKALTLYHAESMPRNQPAAGQFMEGWMQIFEELDQWYSMRPLEFQPMVEVDENDQMLNPDSEFPILLFANGVGSFSNQLYHTAMLVLLQCKPRTVMMNNPHTIAMSPLWHAQRVCGIALNVDRRECWDPSLLATFLVAGKQMTHECQQEEILRGFARIHSLTGWDTGEYLTHLQEDWAFLEGS